MSTPFVRAILFSALVTGYFSAPPLLLSQCCGTTPTPSASGTLPLRTINVAGGKLRVVLLDLTANVDWVVGWFSTLPKPPETLCSRPLRTTAPDADLTTVITELLSSICTSVPAGSVRNTATVPFVCGKPLRRITPRFVTQSLRPARA